MKIFYWQSPSGNFGDDLNEWIWDDLLPGWRQWDPACTLLGVGTILNRRNFVEGERYLLCGSGTGFGEPPDVSDPGVWRIAFVRGPRTAALMNIPSALAICDPAIMIPRISRFASPARDKEIIFIPHCGSDAAPIYDWKRICARAGVEYVSPRRDSHQVIRAVSSATKVITESMHGAIIADAFRVPWKPVSLVDNFNLFKWRDWTDSLRMELNITALPKPLIETNPVSRALSRISRQVIAHQEVKYKEVCFVNVKSTWKRLASAIQSIKTGDFYLSNDNTLLTRQERIAGCLAELRERYG
jgi:succinoglycan biosynthesis protein ExoV